MPRLTSRYSGVAWYLVKASFQAESDSGGSVPTIGCHSVIDSPECVSRVTPPMTTIANTSAQQVNSHVATARRASKEDAGARVPCAGTEGAKASTAEFYYGAAMPMPGRLMPSQPTIVTTRRPVAATTRMLLKAGSSSSEKPSFNCGGDTRTEAPRPAPRGRVGHERARTRRT